MSREVPSREVPMILAEHIRLTADDLSEIRDLVLNANRPVLEALGAVLKELQELRSDIAQEQANNSEQFSTLRKAVFRGAPAAE